MNAPGGHADPAYLLDSSGPAAPPRDNGELVFAAPWESRAFGLALALNEAGLIEWEDFRRALIREIGAWEAAHPSGAGWSYYECWLAALEHTASARGLIDPRAVAGRAAMLAARPAGHDHDRHGRGAGTDERGRAPAGDSPGSAPPGQHGHDGHEHDMHDETPRHP
jgi:nitrile hydratase accessory protein